MSTILVDFNSLSMMSIFSKDVISNKEHMFDMWEFILFDRIFNFCFNVKKKTDEVIIAIDYPKSWRKLIYKPYKSNRENFRKDSDLDFEEYFKRFDEFRHQIKTSLPFKVIRCKNCEADDVIATLVLHKQKTTNCIIYARDSDYNTLINSKVSLFSPAGNKEIKCDTKDKILIDSLNGRNKDNVYNCLTPYNWDKSHGRKPRMGVEKAKKIIESGLDKWFMEQGDDVKKRFDINKIILDNYNIPQRIQDSIINTYENYELPDPENIVKFFKVKNWRDYNNRLNYVESKLLNLY